LLHESYSFGKSSSTAGGDLTVQFGRMRFVLLLLFSIVCRADWLTYAHDPQRTGNNPAERKLSPESAGRLSLLWSVQLDNAPVALSALTAPLVADDVMTSAGAKTLLFVAGSSDTFFAVDTATGKVVWNRTFLTFASPKEEPFYLCPDTPNATPVIDREHSIVYTIAVDGRIYGLDLATGEVKFGPFAFIPPYAKAWSLNLRDGVLYTTTSQACGGDRSGIYAMRVSDPLHVQSRELLVRTGFGGGMWMRGGTVIGPDGTVYVSTGDGAFDPAQGDFSNVYLAAPPDLSRVSDYFSPQNWNQLSKLDLDLPSGGLVAFPFEGKELLAGGGKESVIYLMNAVNLGGKNHQEPLYTSPVLANQGRALEEKGIWGTPAVWTDTAGQTWLYFPVWGPLAETMPRFPVTNGDTPHGSILAFKVTTSAAGLPCLDPAWISLDMNLPDAPVVANGVMYGIATGENPRQDHILGVTHYKSMEEWRHNLLTTAERSAGTHPAVLMAMDAKTGKLLYQSGDAMKTWVHFTGLAVTGGRVFAVDHESRVYCFGLPERTTGRADVQGSK
jgi:outer membrane protein assembly factor BamB